MTIREDLRADVLRFVASELEQIVMRALTKQVAALSADAAAALISEFDRVVTDPSRNVSNLNLFYARHAERIVRDLAERLSHRDPAAP